MGIESGLVVAVPCYYDADDRLESLLFSPNQIFLLVDGNWISVALGTVNRRGVLMCNFQLLEHIVKSPPLSL
jgi:hypothetical protein